MESNAVASSNLVHGVKRPRIETNEGKTAVLDDSQTKLSRHLAQLRTCGLLEDRRQGQWVYYRFYQQLPELVQEVLQVTLKANQT